MNLDFGKVKAFSVVGFIQFVTGVVAPGFLFLFVFKKDLFLNLDLFRLSALAVSIGAFVFSVNFPLMLAWLAKQNNDEANDTDDSEETEDDEEEQRHTTFVGACFLGSLFSALVLYFPIFIGYVFHLLIRSAIFMVAALEIIVLILILYATSRPKPERKR